MPGGSQVGSLKKRPVVVHALLHVAEHVAGSVRRRGIGSDADIGARIQELRHRATTENRSDRARVVGNARACIGDDADLLRGQVGGMRQEGIRAKNAEFLRVGDAALVVSVLREDEAALTGEVAPS